MTIDGRVIWHETLSPSQENGGWLVCAQSGGQPWFQTTLEPRMLGFSTPHTLEHSSCCPPPDPSSFSCAIHLCSDPDGISSWVREDSRLLLSVYLECRLRSDHATSTTPPSTSLLHCLSPFPNLPFPPECPSARCRLYRCWLRHPIQSSKRPLLLSYACLPLSALCNNKPHG